jgi:hypothetical protein
VRTRTVLTLALVAACGAAVAGTWAGRLSRGTPAASQPAAPSDLVIDPAGLDFGEAWETDQFEWTVSAHNASSAPIRASIRASSCSCVAPAAATLIPPGGSAPLKFRIDLRTRCASVAPVPAEDVRIKVSVGVDGGAGRPAEVELRGRVRRALAVGARLIDFGRIDASAPPVTRAVPVRALTNLRELTATPDEAVVEVETHPTGEGRWEIRKHPAPHLPPGKYKTVVRLRPVLATGEPVPPASLPVEFELPGDVQPDSAVIALGARHVGDVIETPVTLSSRSGRPFVVSACVAEPKDGIDVDAGHAEGASHAVTVRLKASAAGDQKARVRFQGKDAAGKAFEAIVEVVYYGLAPRE